MDFRFQADANSSYEARANPPFCFFSPEGGVGVTILAPSGIQSVV